MASSTSLRDGFWTVVCVEGGRERWVLVVDALRAAVGSELAFSRSLEEDDDLERVRWCTKEASLLLALLEGCLETSGPSDRARFSDRRFDISVV